MIKRLQSILSLVSDLIQVGGFLGLTPALVIASATALAGWAGKIPWFWLLVGTVFVFTLVVFLTQEFILRVGTLPLAKAARSAYEQLRGTLWAAAAERMRVDQTPEGILDYLATGLSLHVPIYGKYLPSSKVEKILDSDLRSGSIEGGATFLRIADNRHLEVSDLFVRKRDLRAAIAHMRASTEKVN